MDTSLAASKFTFRRLVSRPFRRDVAHRSDATPLPSDGKISKEGKDEDEKILRLSVAKIFKKTIPKICTSRKFIDANFKEGPKSGMDFMDPAVDIEPPCAIRPEAIVTISPMISPILVQGVFVPSPTLVHINSADFPSTGSETPDEQESLPCQVVAGVMERLTCAEPHIAIVDETESLSDYGSGSTASEKWPGAKDINLSDIPEIIFDGETSIDRYSGMFGDRWAGLENSVFNQSSSSGTVNLTPRACEKHAHRYAKSHMPELDNSLSALALLLSPTASTSGPSTPALETPVFHDSHGAGVVFNYSGLVDEDLADHLANAKHDSRRYSIYHKEEPVGGIFQRN